MLDTIIKDIRNFDGILRKKDIGWVVNLLKGASNFGNTISINDDSAVLKNGKKHLLFAADGIRQEMLIENPFNAGRAAVIVNVSDIYAMGGKPIAMVNVLGMANRNNARLILKGIKGACKKFKVPMVGGHLHPDLREPSLSIAIIGETKKILFSNTAKIGQSIIIAVDIKGKVGNTSIKAWDSSLFRSSKKLLNQLTILNTIAEKELSETAKDISTGGIIGTIAFIMEASMKGAIINMDRIPKPKHIPLNNWLKIFPSYGFILTADKNKVENILKLFRKEDIVADDIGIVTKERKIILKTRDEEGILFDFKKERIQC